MFFPSGFEHFLTSHAGSAWARRPVGGQFKGYHWAAEGSAQDTEGDDGFPPQAPR
jgi:hypothetical protein